MTQFKQRVGFTLVIVLGLQYFGIHQFCMQYLDIRVNYYAECATPKSSRPSVVTASFRTTKAITTKTPTTKCIPNAPANQDDRRDETDKHPISRLFEIQAKNHDEHPIFNVIDERGEIHKREFHVQVKVKDKTTSAWGFTKKEAKRRAAIEMLTLLGVTVETDRLNTVC